MVYQIKNIHVLRRRLIELQGLKRLFQPKWFCDCVGQEKLNQSYFFSLPSSTLPMKVVVEEFLYQNQNQKREI